MLAKMLAVVEEFSKNILVVMVNVQKVNMELIQAKVNVKMHANKLAQNMIALMEHVN